MGYKTSKKKYKIHSVYDSGFDIDQLAKDKKVIFFISDDVETPRKLMRELFIDFDYNVPDDPKEVNPIDGKYWYFIECRPEQHDMMTMLVEKDENFSNKIKLVPYSYFLNAETKTT